MELTFTSAKIGISRTSLCKSCKAEKASKWYDVSCEECGATIKACTDWDHPPKYCKSCKERRHAKWYEKSCEKCGADIKVCVEWDTVPKLCTRCKQAVSEKWYDKPCEVCGEAIRANRDWDKPPRYCKSCSNKYSKKSISCSQCGKAFEISTALQVKCRANGHGLPSRCPECKHDALLIKGAIGALRDKFPFALEATIEQRGIIFTDKVAVVRGKKSGDVVAEVKMGDHGIILTERVATAIDPKTGKEFSRTKDGQEGIIFTKRTADTYDSSTGRHTHRTKMIEKGVIFPKHIAETKSRDNPTAPVTHTTVESKGWLFVKEFFRSVKK